MRLRLLGLSALALACGCPSASPESREYLYLWTGSSDSTQPDFLAVLDVTEAPLRYGRLVTTVPVPGLKNGPHHTEHQMPADRRLFANGFASGKTFVFDMSDPAAPRLDGQLGEVGGMVHPHSYLRLPNGNVLATFQMWHASAGALPGGLAELTPQGKVVRSSSANLPGVDKFIRPYSAAIVPSLDRVVVTTTDMVADYPASRTIEVWRLSDLKLLHSFPLPDGPRGDEGLYSAEPRVLADGRTVLVSTFNCGLFLLEGLETESPSARLVSSFPWVKDKYCAVPVIAGSYYLVTVPAWHAVVSLDISNPAAPKEVSRATLDTSDVPHWISISPDHRRVVVTGYGTLKHRVVMLNFDSSTGQLEINRRFREVATWKSGLRMDNKTWPHGGNAPGVPHGAVFSGLIEAKKN
ncbi:MAG TPA: hypothetical protein VJU15_00900 [Gemmatimonadales bacterium]|nr:hypothetical protein [Gemmatimonadales bacterium]